LPIPLTLNNPNGVPTYVTGLTVTVTSNTAACDSAQNISLTQAGVSPATPVVIPANGSVTLPAQGVSAPAIQLVDLVAVNQDACRGASFPLRYAGSGHS
jgi:hypothetical protein